MQRVIIEQADVIKTIQARLTELGAQPEDKLIITIREGEMIIRPLSARDAEMHERVRVNMKKYSDALRRLADS
jgi:bifunctional DNA-binding transcriptional regulator/antitoxin component of YhaV-PrlF toxin-antitoxin module